MRKHDIPRKKQNETRIFIIFSVRSLISTIIGVTIGAIIGIIPLLLNFQVGLFISVGIFGLVGFLVGTFPVMYIPGIPITKDIQGDYLYNIIFSYYVFKGRRSLKMYSEEEQ